MNYQFNAERKEASKYVREQNKAVLSKYNFDEKQDFDFANRGFIATIDEPDIKEESGRAVVILNEFGDNLNIEPENAPDTVNPSLWRQLKLTNIHGLFKVCDDVYQVRSFDIANLTAIRGEKGWVIIDALTSCETSKTAFDLLCKHVEKLPITAIILTHSHADHFGGIRGLVTHEDVESGRVQIIAPHNFTYEVSAENVIAGNAMGRRAQYQLGTKLQRDFKGSLGQGLGSLISTGKITLIKPTTELPQEEKIEMKIDGVDFIFTEAQNTEAVSEFICYMPKLKVLCSAEVANRTQHNLLTVRGAQIRSSHKWAKVVDRTLELFGNDVEYIVGTHHWPVFGHDESIDFLASVRDAYLFLHNETMRLVNLGATIKELPFLFEYPEEILKKWYTHGYYGHEKHNTKAIYQFYLGWYDGNPSTYLELPTEESGKYFIEMMGGADAVVEKCAKYMEEGKFLWVAEALNKVVFAEPNHQNAKFMLADALEQIGYTEESGIRRNAYVKGAQELRDGVGTVQPLGFSDDLLIGLTAEQILDFIAIRFDHKKVTGDIKIKFDFVDLKETRILELTKNKVLHNKISNEDAILSVTGSKKAILGLLGSPDPKVLIESGAVKVEGDMGQLKVLGSACDTFTPDFNVVTP